MATPNSLIVNHVLNMKATLNVFQDEGTYVVNVKFCGVDVPKAPFSLNIYQDGPRNKIDLSKVQVEGPGLTGEGLLPGGKAWIKIHYKDAGPAEPKIEIVGPDRCVPCKTPN